MKKIILIIGVILSFFLLNLSCFELKENKFNYETNSVIGSTIDGISFPSDNRYYDSYQYGEVAEENGRRIFGDATGEMGPFMTKIYGTQTRQIGSWYVDEAWFVVSTGPWYYRGSAYVHGTGAGVFTFVGSYGYAHRLYSFRIILH